MELRTLLVLMLLMQSTTSVESSLQNDAPVKLELYYESLCFACQNFISGPLQEAWKSLQSSGTLVVRNTNVSEKPRK